MVTCSTNTEKLDKGRSHYGPIIRFNISICFHVWCQRRDFMFGVRGESQSFHKYVLSLICAEHCIKYWGYN